MSALTVTVIVLNYNHARFVRERIDSVLAETYRKFEVLILDGASTDESRAVIESYRSHPEISIE